jgi:hypothetical protein
MHTFQPASARVCRRTRAILAHSNASLFSHLSQIFGSISNEQHFLCARLLLCAPYLRLILAQTSMKPMQMIRAGERKVSFAADCKKKTIAGVSPSIFEVHRGSCIFAPPVCSAKNVQRQCLPSRKVSHLLFRRDREVRAQKRQLDANGD